MTTTNQIDRTEKIFKKISKRVGYISVEKLLMITFQLVFRLLIDARLVGRIIIAADDDSCCG